ncbi:hypothetical protein ABH926_006605 [Catenulispora sp. GP43]|uniref:hypothetical protein n=1 Tax=Catenulispora sp. GP43 TaxID=3156263 RepID=UPI0035127C76
MLNTPGGAVLGVVVVPFFCAMILTFVAALLVLLVLLAARIVLLPVALARRVRLRAWLKPPFDRFRRICSAIAVIADSLEDLLDKMPPTRPH